MHKLYLQSAYTTTGTFVDDIDEDETAQSIQPEISETLSL